MTILALALHILGAIVWVGGMFAIYMCLRPALGTLEPSQRLRLMRVTFQKFFPWVWATILVLLASGYWMVFMTFGGMARIGLHVHLMQGIGWVMIALFFRGWLFHGPWPSPSSAPWTPPTGRRPARSLIESVKSSPSTCRSVSSWPSSAQPADIGRECRRAVRRAVRFSFHPLCAPRRAVTRHPRLLRSRGPSH